MEKKKRIIGSFIAKIIAFFLLTVSAFGTAFCGLSAIYFVEEDYYTASVSDIFLDESSDILFDAARQVWTYLAAGEIKYAEAVCEGKNFDIALLDEISPNVFVENDTNIIWTTYDGSYETGLMYNIPSGFFTSGSFTVNGHKINPDRSYVFRIYIDTGFPETDMLSVLYRECEYLNGYKYLVLWILGVSVIVLLNSFLFLMCSAGHSNYAEEIRPSVFTDIPLDLYSAGYGVVAILILLVFSDTAYRTFDSLLYMVFLSLLAAAFALWCTFYLRELAVRIKLGRWWRNTVVFYMLRLMGRLVRLVWKCIGAMFKSFPLLLNTLICFFGIFILEFFGVCLFVRRGGVILWMLEKLVLFPVVIYAALMCKRLLQGSRALAEGRQDEIVDTRYMFGDFKECGENLNSIGKGIAKAVAERMKSEHLKTELITNVSHDLKTPLTSIINYANLIAEEPVENEKITEYSEVLVRQSGRLKKLLEDLVEASKATTGNLDVDLQPCEVGVILSQALGEYQQRMEEKQLELIVSQPEETMSIMADGRHLWRIFDNLLNNICKYAREDSRVYLSVEEKDSMINIIFRNMSKYALNINAEELQERFVRGDKSRHMEGNGLGLSIAKSLTELQDGRMDIVTDGDLFKVSLIFAKI